MTTWTFDEKRYREEVLKAMAEGWPPSEDLFRCYQLSLDVDDEQVIARALKTVQSHVNNTRRGAEWAAVLRKQHERAKQTLTTPALRQQHRQQVLQRRQEISPLVQAEVAGLPAVPPAAVTRIVGRVAPRFIRDDVEAALADLRVVHRTPLQLPPRAKLPVSWSEVRGALAALERRSAGGAPGYTSLRDYLLETFATVRVEAAALVDRKRRSHGDRPGDGATYEAKVLVATMKWRDDGLLEEVLRTELLEQLASAARLGLPRLQQEVRRADVTAVLLDLGLPGDLDDLAFAVLCATRFPDDAAPAWLVQYDSALRSRDLRGALSILESQGQLPQGHVEKREELRHRVAALDADLGCARSLESSDPESAAQLYVEVGRTLDDPDVAAGLARCHPAPPPEARATVEGDRVLIRWTSSPARVGVVTYRVLRGEKRRPVAGASTVVLDGVDAHEAVDAAPPAGAPLHYAVVALRDGVPSRAAAHADPVVVVRDVADLQVTAGQGYVEGSWRLPAGATGAAVERTVRSSGDRCPGSSSSPLAIPALSGDSFRDRSVHEGVTYEYRVQAEYRGTGGAMQRSAGLTRRARAQQRPAPVDDLGYEVRGELVVVTWTAPPVGDVEVRLVEEEPAVEPGQVLPRSAVRTMGTVLHAVGPTGRSGLQAMLPSHTVRRWILPLTVLDELVAIGRPIELHRNLPPVSGLRATRLGSAVRLSWKWPPQVGEVEVTWTRARSSDQPDQRVTTTRTVTLAGYLHTGVHWDVGAGDHSFTVSPLARIDGDRVLGPERAVQASVPREVYYHVVKRGWPRPRYALVVDAVDGVALPTIHLVARPGVPPQEVADGIECLVLPGSGDEGKGVVGEFVPPPHRQLLHLRAFPAGSGSSGIALLPRHPDQLRIV